MIRILAGHCRIYAVFLYKELVHMRLLLDTVELVNEHLKSMTCIDVKIILHVGLIDTMHS